jgi:ADP-ribose pyrophosphatase YjhB (NUDIX family)
MMLTPTYCPRCGAPLERRFAEGRDREVCPACGFVFYRNPVPAVGVVVALDDRVVLIRRRYEPRAGCWGLPAGYMELGESAEEAAARECYEETGLLVQIDHLLGVYSFGTGEQSGLVIIYAATAVGGQLQAGDDATEVGAFPLDALPTPIAFRTHLQAIERWRREGRPSVGQPRILADDRQAIVVRYAVRTDAPAALTLLLGDPDVDPAQRLAVEALFHDRLHDPDRPILAVEAAGVLAGVALLSFHQTLRGWHATLDEIVIAPGMRRRGLGSALVEAAVRLARERGATTIHALLASEPPAMRAFLIANGFAAGRVLTLAL